MTEKNKYIVCLVGHEHYTVQHAADRFEEKRVVLFDGRYLLPHETLKEKVISLDFGWGDSGLDSRQLAFAILAQFTDFAECDKYYRALVHDFLSLMPSHQGFYIPIKAVESWLKAKRRNKMTKIYESANIIDPENKLGMISSGVSYSRPPTTTTVGRKAPWKDLFTSMEIGHSVYITDSKEIKTAEVLKTTYGKALNRRFAGKRLSPEWAREKGIECPREAPFVYGIWREK